MSTLLHYKPLFILLMALIGWPLLSGILSVMLKRKTPAEWEKWALSKPVLAFGIELMKALGWDLPKVMVLLQRYAQRKAGQVPDGAIAAAGLPASITALLNDPVKLAALEETAKKLAGLPAVPPPQG